MESPGQSNTKTFNENLMKIRQISIWSYDSLKFQHLYEVLQNINEHAN